MSRTIDLLTVRVGAEMHEVLEGFDALTTRAEKVGRKLTSVGKKLTLGITAPLAGIGAASIKMASDAEEAANKFDVVMGASAASARAELQQLMETIPATSAEMEGMAAGLQDLLVPMGVARKEAAGMSVGMVKLAGDVASFNNVLPTEALDAMRSALAGESEPMRRFGVDTRVAALEAVALEEGLIGAGEAMNDTARAQAVMLAIQKDSTDAMGDAEATVNATSNQMKFFARDVKQLGIEIGQVLIPAFRPLLAIGNDFLGVLRDLSPKTIAMGIAVGGLAAAVGPLLIVVGNAAIAFRGLTTAVAAFNIAMMTGPIGWIVGGALAAGLIAVAAGFRVMSRAANEVGEAATPSLEELKSQLATAKDAMERFKRSADAAGDTALGRNFRRQGQAAAAEYVRLSGEIEKVERQLSVTTPAAVATAAAATTELFIPAVGAVNEGLLRMHSVEIPALNGMLPLLSGNIETAGDGAEESVDKFRALKDAIGDVALQGVDAFVDFASGAGNAMKEFVKGALKQLGRLLARMLVIKGIMTLLPGVGNFLGFDKFAGGFATGGHIPAGQFGLVGEAGSPEIVSSPSFVQGPANVTPMGAGGDSVFHVTFVTPDGRQVADTQTFRQKRGEALNRVIRLPVQVAAGT